MQVEEKPDVTYSDVGGCKEQIEKLREVVEVPLLHVRNISGWLVIVALSTGCYSRQNLSRGQSFLSACLTSRSWGVELVPVSICVFEFSGVSQSTHKDRFWQSVM